MTPVMAGHRIYFQISPEPGSAKDFAYISSISGDSNRPEAGIGTFSSRMDLLSKSVANGGSRLSLIHTRTLVVGPYLEGSLSRKAGPGASIPVMEGRPQEARLFEATGLAHAIGLDVVAALACRSRKFSRQPILGKGNVAELAALAAEKDAGLIVMDCALSPVQQRNLERAFAAKVIDRTGLILEIFGRRARTREGALQVELAHLAYQKSRLVRSWTHLERQRGGFGFLGGPGETQIEADRRLIEERMTRIKHELEERQADPWPASQEPPRGSISDRRPCRLYKCRQIHALQQADQGRRSSPKTCLFATLDPTLRRVTLPHGGQVILSDTVGFISDLPTMLVKAFRATLEEVLEADLILHVRDIAHEDAEAQRDDVEAILRDLGIDAANDRRLMEVWNKCDLLDDASACGGANAAASRICMTNRSLSRP